VRSHRIAFHEKHRGQLFCDDSSERIVDLLLRECARGAVTTFRPCAVHEVARVGAEAGGPRFVLHTDDYLCDGVSMPVKDGLALTTTKDVLQALTGEAAPRRAFLALGYAGWGPGQLEREVRESAWLVCDADETLLFGDDHDHKWAQALEKLGISPAMLSMEGGRA
jgi:putative AlgH/UPF0301 family transcriptional regulator